MKKCFSTTARLVIFGGIAAVMLTACSSRGDLDDAPLSNNERQFLAGLSANNKTDEALLAAGSALCLEWREAAATNGYVRSAAYILDQWEIGGSDVTQIEEGAASTLCHDAWVAWMAVDSQRRHYYDGDTFSDPEPVEPPDWTPAG